MGRFEDTQAELKGFAGIVFRQRVARAKKALLRVRSTELRRWAWQVKPSARLFVGEPGVCRNENELCSWNSEALTTDVGHVGSRLHLHWSEHPKSGFATQGWNRR